MVKANDELQCAVITPDRQVLDAAVQSVVLPAHDGQIGVLRDRAPLLCKLGIGIVKLDVAGRQQRVYVDGGFAQVLNNVVTVLTPYALEPDQIKRKRAEADLQAAQALPITDDASFEHRQNAIARAKAQLELVRSS